MEYAQMTLDDWVGMKESLKKDLIGVQESFVRIGYKLRQIEEQKLYEKDGYPNITEFAKAEYGLSGSSVSRFMAINRKYSINGYSDTLQPEFAQLGSSKLSEMLALPEPDMQMIRPEATRGSIRELKQFNKTEPEEGVADELQTLIENFYRDNKEILNELYTVKETGKSIEYGADTKDMVEIVNPSGSRTYKKGMFFLMMYENNIKIKKFGTTPEELSWEGFFGITRDLFAEDAAGPDTYTNHFGGGEDDAGASAEEETGRTEEAEQDREETGADRPGEEAVGENPNNADTEPAEARNDDAGGDHSNGNDDEDNTGELEEKEIEDNGRHDANYYAETEEADTGADAESGTQGREQGADKSIDSGDKRGTETVGETEQEEQEEDTECHESDEQTAKTQTGEIAPAQEEPDFLGKSMNLPQVEEQKCSRKDYIDTLTAYGLAQYMAQEYKEHRLMASMLAFPSELEEWLNESVDCEGRPEYALCAVKKERKSDSEMESWQQDRRQD